MERIFTQTSNAGARTNPFTLTECSFGLNVGKMFLLWKGWDIGTGCPETFGCTFPGSVQGQNGWGFEQLDPVEPDLLTHVWGK